jgi:hypothetical protein
LQVCSIRTSLRNSGIVSVILTLTLLNSVITAFLSFPRRILEYHSYYIRTVAFPVCFNS